jgi:hypothetical protein
LRCRPLLGHLHQWLRADTSSAAQCRLHSPLGFLIAVLFGILGLHFYAQLCPDRLNLMPLARTIFAVEMQSGLRPLFSVLEKASGELIIPVNAGQKFGPDPSVGPTILEQRYSIHPSLRSADYTTIKLTTNLGDGRQITNAVVTDAVKKSTGFAMIFIRRMSNMDDSLHRISESDKAKASIQVIPGYDPENFTLIHGLLIGPPDLPFNSSNAKISVTQHFFKRFSIVIPAGLVPYPSNNTIDLAQVQTLRPELAETPDDEVMAGKSPAVCERQFEFGVRYVMKYHLTQRLPELRDPKVIQYVKDHIAFLENELQQWKEGAIFSL